MTKPKKKCIQVENSKCRKTAGKKQHSNAGKKKCGHLFCAEDHWKGKRKAPISGNKTTKYAYWFTMRL